LRIWVVTASATRVICGTNTMVSETIELVIPGTQRTGKAQSPIGRTERRRNTSTVRMTTVLSRPADITGGDTQGRARRRRTAAPG